MHRRSDRRRHVARLARAVPVRLGHALELDHVRVDRAQRHARVRGQSRALWGRARGQRDGGWTEREERAHVRVRHTPVRGKCSGAGRSGLFGARVRSRFAVRGCGPLDTPSVPQRLAGVEASEGEKTLRKDSARRNVTSAYATRRVLA